MTAEGIHCGESPGTARIEEGNEESRAIREAGDKDRGKEGMRGATGGAEKTADSDLVIQDFPVFIRDEMSGIRAIEREVSGGGMAGRAGRSQGREMLEKSQIEGVFVEMFKFVKKAA